MANRVRAQVSREEEAAEYKSAGVHLMMLLKAKSEVVTPTIPAMKENMTKNPVAMFPMGKKIGNIRVGRDKADAAQDDQQTLGIN